MNLTKESEELDTREKTIKEPKTHDSTKIVKYLKENFGELCNYDKTTKTIYLCDNNVLAEPKFIEFLKKYRVYIQPSLF
jgi:hypothetical protein